MLRFRWWIVIIFIIIISPMGINLIISLPSPFSWRYLQTFEGPGDWIAFFGNYLGGIIGAIVAILVAYLQVKHAKEQFKVQIEEEKLARNEDKAETMMSRRIENRLYVEYMSVQAEWNLRGNANLDKSQILITREYGLKDREPKGNYIHLLHFFKFSLRGYSSVAHDIRIRLIFNEEFQSEEYSLSILSTDTNIYVPNIHPSRPRFDADSKICFHAYKQINMIEVLYTTIMNERMIYTVNRIEDSQTHEIIGVDGERKIIFVAHQDNFSWKYPYSKIEHEDHRQQ
jgi:hypothetical protein